MDSPLNSTVYTNKLDASLANLNREIWQQLTAAPTQKENGFKTCTLATATADGLPDARIVVLRQADASSRTLWFHTDVRAQKVAQLRAKPQAVLLFWDDQQQVQLRCRVTTTIHTNDPTADAQWAKTWEGSRKMYLSEYEPGSAQAEPYPGFPRHFGPNLPTREESEMGRPNFAVVECAVLSIDYLQLGRAGQTRVRFGYEGDALEGAWLAP